MTQEEILAEDDRLITNDVARAVEERELIAYYQPIVSLATQDVISAEALVRWTMPDGTIVPAGLFVPSLERTNTILGLDWYMVEEVCAFLEAAAGTKADVPIALNLSPRHATDPDFVSKLAASTDWHNVAHDRIRLEFRQVNTIDGNKDLDTLVRTAVDRGFSISVDNFADSADVLAPLASLGISSVKLARSLWEAADVASLGQYVAAAAEHGIALSAESVEEQDEIAKLIEAGIRSAQGFLFAKPMDGAAFRSFCDR